MPRTAEQCEEIRHERRDQILDAALSVYVRKGYAASEVADVADEAGLARGLVYYYFDTKQHLFQQLFTWMSERTHELARRYLVESEGSPRERLLGFARVLCQGCLEDPRPTLFYLRAYQDAEQVFEGRDRADVRNLEAMRSYITAVIAEGMERAEFRCGDPALAANAFWGSLSMNFRELTDRASHEESEKLAMVEEALGYCMYGLAGAPSAKGRS